ncbi:Splicing factor [Dionaea muscipula]
MQGALAADSVIRKRFQGNSSWTQGGGGRLFTLFVDDIPDSMDHIDISKLFARFGLVRDVFLPRKRSKAGKKFVFVRYDCPVAAEVAIKRMNGVWMHDKELKVKMADFHMQHGVSSAKVPLGMVKGIVAASQGVVRGKSVRPVRDSAQHNSITSHVQLFRQRSPGLRMAWVPVRTGKHAGRVDSYADAVRKGTRSQEDVPMVVVDTIGNRMVSIEVPSHR